MFLSEAEAEAALRDLRHRRDALDRAEEELEDRVEGITAGVAA